MTAKKSSRLSLYVWEDVLCDYTSGCMFAFAASADEARSLILKKCHFVPTCDLAQEPKCINAPEGFAIWGGG